MTILLSSCNKNECEVPNYDLVRKVALQLNSETEKNLNSITQILHNHRYLKNNLVSKTVPARLENEIFFNLNKDNNVLHFREIHYKNLVDFEINHYRNYDIPIDEIDTESIEIIYMTEGSVYENSAVITIKSKFNNTEAFNKQSVVIENGKEVVKACATDEGFSINIKSEDAELLKKSLVSFIKNYNNQ